MTCPLAQNRALEKLLLFDKSSIVDFESSIVDFVGSSSLQTRRLYLDTVDSLFARVSSGGTAAWYLPDRLGSIRNIVDSGGALIDTITYDGFGVVTSESSTANGDRYKFTGRELDSESGLQYNDARYYDSKTGRWYAQDPLGLLPDSNPYRYVKNSPTNAIDPSGLVALFFDGAGTTEKDRTIIYRMYEASKDPQKKYVKSPLAWKDLREFERNAVQSAGVVIKACIQGVKEERKEPIDLIGWSRGGALAVATANTIDEFFKAKQLHIEIRFMGLLDPVSNPIIGAPNKIPAIVKILWLGVRDGTKDKGDPTSRFVPLMRLRYEDEDQTQITRKTYPLTHTQMGRDAQVGKDVYEAAKKAGMELGPLPQK